MSASRGGEQAYLRNGLFAIELLDAVTLLRVTAGVTVVAHGLRATPIVNTSGMFVWLRTTEDISQLEGITIEPGALPYERVERDASQLQLPPLPRPLTTIELPPRVDYAFAAGVTGVRGTLIEERVVPSTPVAAAEIRLRWLDEDGVTWREAPTTSHTTANGDFVAALRLTPAAVPHVNASGEVTLRVWARRDGAVARQSADFKLPQGRVADPSTLNTLTFAWDELQP